MSKSSNPNSFSSIILVVVFLALTAIATILYGGNDEQKAKLEQNFFYQKTRLVFSYVRVGAQSLIDINLNKNIGAKIKAEWQKGDQADQGPDQDAGIDNFLNWQKTETGRELIFRTKNGEEYKLSLPFKFLSH